MPATPGMPVASQSASGSVKYVTSVTVAGPYRERQRAGRCHLAPDIVLGTLPATRKECDP